MSLHFVGIYRDERPKGNKQIMGSEPHRLYRNLFGHVSFTVVQLIGVNFIDKLSPIFCEHCRLYRIAYASSFGKVFAANKRSCYRPFGQSSYRFSGSRSSLVTVRVLMRKRPIRFSATWPYLIRMVLSFHKFRTLIGKKHLMCSLLMEPSRRNGLEIRNFP